MYFRRSSQGTFKRRRQWKQYNQDFLLLYENLFRDIHKNIFVLFINIEYHHAIRADIAQLEEVEVPITAVILASAFKLNCIIQNLN